MDEVESTENTEIEATEIEKDESIVDKVLDKAEDIVETVKAIFSGDTSINEIIENIADETTDFGAGEVADYIEEKYGDSEGIMSGGQGIMMGFIKDFYPRLADENKEEVLSELGLVVKTTEA